MTAGFNWIPGPPTRGLFAEECGHPRSKQYRSRGAPADKPWSTADGFDFVIRRRDGFYFVADPARWSTSWRAATRFPDFKAADQLIAPKSSTAPAGAAAERGAEVLRLGPEINR